MALLYAIKLRRRRDAASVTRAASRPSVTTCKASSRQQIEPTE